MAALLPTPTDADVRRVLDRQVQVMLRLADDVLDGVTLDECLWTADDRSWSVHRRDGVWVGELGEEPPDLPLPSLGWTMWHPIWWLSVLLADAGDVPRPSHDEVEWPGPDSSLATIRSRWNDWMGYLDGLSDLQLRTEPLVRFPYDDGRAVVHVAGWSAMELVKNLSEMCVLRRQVPNSERISSR